MIWRILLGTFLLGHAVAHLVGVVGIMSASAARQLALSGSGALYTGGLFLIGFKMSIFQRESRWLFVLVILIPLVAFLIAIVIPAIMRN